MLRSEEDRPPSPREEGGAGTPHPRGGRVAFFIEQMSSRANLSAFVTQVIGLLGVYLSRAPFSLAPSLTRT